VTRLRQINRKLGIHLAQRFIDDPHLRAVAQIEQSAHRVFRHTEFFCQSQFRPAASPQRFINSQFRGHEGRQYGAIRPRVSSALPRKWFSSLHVTFQRSYHTIAGVAASFILSLSFGQRVGWVEPLRNPSLSSPPHDGYRFAQPILRTTTNYLIASRALPRPPPPRSALARTCGVTFLLTLISVSVTFPANLAPVKDLPRRQTGAGERGRCPRADLQSAPGRLRASSHPAL